MAPSVSPAVMSEASSEEEEVASTSCAVSRNPMVADARSLLAHVVSKRSVQYNAFKESWTEQEFWFVYCAGTDPLRKEEVVTCLVAEGMRYLISRSRDHERLAGLYLIYTVFCTQPLNPKALIRVTADDWTALIELQEVIREKKYAEAGYILHYLRKERAFTLTYTSQQKCMTRTSSDNSGQQLHRTFLTSSRSLHPKFLSSLSKVNNTYSGGSNEVS
ncbi:snRNA-activating protein complex subunit 1 [Geodia barretti]|uniref:snRNA-activating protein complex subunit 1 n=1 Tax=Geodia barretti TaxID=519541 RepID=A0AA35TS54_GEOBA|nr:snRNA-activating protein complex subunit 1 [Geodia barretti]